MGIVMIVALAVGCLLRRLSVPICMLPGVWWTQSVGRMGEQIQTTPELQKVQRWGWERHDSTSLERLA